MLMLLFAGLLGPTLCDGDVAEDAIRLDVQTVHLLVRKGSSINDVTQYSINTLPSPGRFLIQRFLYCRHKSLGSLP